MKKPSKTTIAQSPPLSVVPLTADRLAVCNVCGRPSEQLGAWRAHDERDVPIAGDRALVFVGVDHPACRKHLDEHPRLFGEEMGEPGHLPLLCGPCTHRAGLACQHPDLKSNGGPGLLIDLHDPLHGAIICGAQGRIRLVRRALKCAGQERATP